MLATISAKWKGRHGAPPPFCCVSFFPGVFAVLIPSWRHFGALGRHLGSSWEVFVVIVASCLVRSWRYLKTFGRKSLHWMGWRGCTKRKELFMEGPLPCISSMHIIHGYRPWISSMDIIHGYHP